MLIGRNVHPEREGPVAPARAARIIDEPAVVAFCPTFTWKAFKDTSASKLHGVEKEVANVCASTAFQDYSVPLTTKPLFRPLGLFAGRAAKTKRNIVKMVVTLTRTLDRILRYSLSPCPSRFPAPTHSEKLEASFKRRQAADAAKGPCTQRSLPWFLNAVTHTGSRYRRRARTQQFTKDKSVNP